MRKVSASSARRIEARCSKRDHSSTLKDFRYRVLCGSMLLIWATRTQFSTFEFSDSARYFLRHRQTGRFLLATLLLWLKRPNGIARWAPACGRSLRKGAKVGLGSYGP